MQDPLDFNAHDAPPQELKDIFKSWKGQLTPERDHKLDETVINMPRLDNIPQRRLNEIFSDFLNDAKDSYATEQVALGSSGSVYSSQNVPGTQIMFIEENRQGRTYLRALSYGI